MQEHSGNREIRMDEKCAPSLHSGLSDGMLVAESTNLPFGSTYELQEEAGRGGSGVVHRGWHRILQRKVAIKIVENSKDAFDKLAKEARLAKLLDHDGIARIYSFGKIEETGNFYLARRGCNALRKRTRTTRQSNVLRKQRPNLPTALSK